MTEFSYAGLTTLDALTDLYGRWLARHSRPAMSADELYYELLAQDPAPEKELTWLAGFINRWERVAHPEEVF